MQDFVTFFASLNKMLTFQIFSFLVFSCYMVICRNEGPGMGGMQPGQARGHHRYTSELSGKNTSENHKKRKSSILKPHKTNLQAIFNSEI